MNHATWPAGVRRAQTEIVNCVRCRRPVQPGARWCAFCGEAVRPLTGETQPLVEPVEAPYVETVPTDAAVGDRPLPASGASIAALVFAIFGLVGPLPLLGSLLALGFAGRGRREAAYGTAGGAEIARAARIIAWTGIILVLVAAAVVVGTLVWLGRLSDYFSVG